MNLRSQVHNAIITKFHREMPLSRETGELPICRNRACSCPIPIKEWDPWCNYVRLYPKQFTVARLLVKYGTSIARIETKNLSISTIDDDGIICGTWIVLAIDYKSSLILAWATGTQRSPFSRSLSIKAHCQEPQFLFNHLDGTKSRVWQIREFIADSQLKKRKYSGVKKN